MTCTVNTCTSLPTATEPTGRQGTKSRRPLMSSFLAGGKMPAMVSLRVLTIGFETQGAPDVSSEVPLEDIGAFNPADIAPAGQSSKQRRKRKMEARADCPVRRIRYRLRRGSFQERLRGFLSLSPQSNFSLQRMATESYVQKAVWTYTARNLV